jgi:Predicted membrane protein (DUF2142)
MLKPKSLHPGLCSLGVSFAIFFALSTIWSLSTPPIAGPDETAHIIKSAAVVRGELFGTQFPSVAEPFVQTTKPSAYENVDVPEFFQQIPLFPCFAVSEQLSPACFQPKGATTNRNVLTETYVARNTPTYYLLPGLPSLISQSWPAITWMRILGAAESSLFLSLSVMAIVLWARRRLLLVSLFVAVTPMVLYLNGVVNPNSLENTTAICLWTAGLLLVFDRPESPPNGLVILFTASAVVMALTRPLSWLWVVCIVMILGVCMGAKKSMGFVKNRSVRVSGIVLTAVLSLSIIWDLMNKALLVLPGLIAVPKNISTSGLLKIELPSLPTYWGQIIGIFDWFNSSVPLMTTMLWFVMIGFLVMFSLVVARWNRAIALLTLTGLVVVGIPILYAVFEARNHGLPWYGRYSLPLFVGIPMLAVALLDHSGILDHHHMAFVRIIGVPAIVGQFAAFVVALRIRMVGASGPIWFLREQAQSWHPTTPVWLLIVGFFAALIAFEFYFERLVALANQGILSDRTEKLNRLVVDET